MIVPTEDMALVNRGKRDRLILPVEYGAQGEKRPRPVEPETCISLQPAPFVKGTKVTLVSVEEWERAQVDDTKAVCLAAPSVPSVWVAVFVLGNRIDFYHRHRERYLRRKGAGLTYDPKLAVRGEPAVTEEEELALARQAHVRRMATQKEQARVQRAVLKAALGEMRGLELTEEVYEEIRRIEWRLKKLDGLLEDGPVAA